MLKEESSTEGSGSEIRWKTTIHNNRMEKDEK